jgi:hypothetical protein
MCSRVQAKCPSWSQTEQQQHKREHVSSFTSQCTPRTQQLTFKVPHWLIAPMLLLTELCCNGMAPTLLCPCTERLLCASSVSACRYEGATAAALPEAIQINQGGSRGKRKTVVANSMITSSTPSVPKASEHGSFASTAQPVNALALSGKRC